MNSLTTADRSELRLITENAQREGWINRDAALDAEYVGPSVRITAARGKSVVQKTYPRDGHWSFRLLRDLACGAYRN